MHAKIIGLSVINNMVVLHFGFYSQNTDPNAPDAVQLASYTFTPQQTDTPASIAQRITTIAASYKHLGELYDQFSPLVGEVIDT